MNTSREGLPHPPIGESNWRLRFVSEIGPADWQQRLWRQMQIQLIGFGMCAREQRTHLLGFCQGLGATAVLIDVGV